MIEVGLGLPLFIGGRGKLDHRENPRKILVNQEVAGIRYLVAQCLN